jgi:DNA primase
MKAENLSYPEAVKFLAEKVGLQVPEDEVDDSQARLKNRILEINRETARYFHAALKFPQAKGVLEYMRGRGLEQKTITRFGLGWAPDSWDSLIKHLRKKGFTDAEMMAACVATKTKNGNLIDFFRNRLMFPIIDVRGNVIAFGGRKLSEEDKGPKYINTPETAVYVKSRNLYGLNYAKSSAFCEALSKSGKERFFILCEGNMDVIALHQAGFDNAVAPLGTALTETQVRIMAKYVPDVMIATDSDEAGKKAAKRSFELLDSAGLGTKIIKIQGAKDPDEFIKKYGSKRFELLLFSSVSAIENELDAILQKYDTDSDSGKVQALKEASKTLAGISNAIERDVYISRISSKLSVSSQAVMQNVEDIIRQRKSSERKKERASLTVENGIRDNVNPQKRKMLSAAVCEEWLLGSLFGHPDFFTLLKKEGLSENDFVTDWGKKMFKLISEEFGRSREPDLMGLGASLTPDEMARLASVITRSGSYVRTREQFCELIASLRAEGRRQALSSENVKQMDDESLKQLIEKLGNEKK